MTDAAVKTPEEAVRHYVPTQCAACCGGIFYVDRADYRTCYEAYLAALNGEALWKALAEAADNREIALHAKISGWAENLPMHSEYEWLRVEMKQCAKD